MNSIIIFLFNLIYILLCIRLFDLEGISVKEFLKMTIEEYLLIGVLLFFLPGINYILKFYLPEKSKLIPSVIIGFISVFLLSLFINSERISIISKKSIIQEMYSDGTPKKIVSFNQQYPENVLHLSYFTNGQLASWLKLKNGLPVEESWTYNMDGSPKNLDIYRGGKLWSRKIFTDRDKIIEDAAYNILTDTGINYAAARKYFEITINDDPINYNQYWYDESGKIEHHQRVVNGVIFDIK